ncbi:hypothetical protein GCM10022214_38610 [Actinomadura miaoliensis]|uniref:Uncharacterized protein n=1 Tax=Actinomadura miaoliensis TaxID=430685 RepID=A0ABP7VYC7_9ACTN
MDSEGREWLHTRHPPAVARGRLDIRVIRLGDGGSCERYGPSVPVPVLAVLHVSSVGVNYRLPSSERRHDCVGPAMPGRKSRLFAVRLRCAEVLWPGVFRPWAGARPMSAMG